MAKKNDKTVTKMIKKINNGIVRKEEDDISSGDETDSESGSGNTDLDSADKLKDAIKKYAKMDEQITEIKTQKLQVMKIIKKKYDLVKFAEHMKELKKQKDKSENVLIDYLGKVGKKTGNKDPTFNIGNWGTLQLCESKKKAPLNLELIKDTLSELLKEKNTFDSIKKQDKFVAQFIELIAINRTIGKKYLKKLKTKKD